MRMIGFILQTLAIGIILLHSIIPHSHHSDLSASAHIKQHAEADSLIELIALGLHADHNEGYLEEFSTSNGITAIDDSQIIQSSVILYVERSLGIQEQNDRLYSNEEITFPERIYTIGASLRGPPSLS